MSAKSWELEWTPLESGESRLLKVEERQIALFNVGGKLYAVDNKCPHRGGPLTRGTVETPKESDSAAVRCPLHGWLFDLNSGACLNQPAACISTYQVQISEGKLHLQSVESAPSHSEKG